MVPPKIGIWPEYQDAMNNAFDEITLQKKTAKQALDAVQARMQPKLDEYLEQLRQREQVAKAKSGIRNSEQRAVRGGASENRKYQI